MEESWDPNQYDALFQQAQQQQAPQPQPKPRKRAPRGFAAFAQSMVGRALLTPRAALPNEGEEDAARRMQAAVRFWTHELTDEDRSYFTSRMLAEQNALLASLAGDVRQLVTSGYLTVQALQGKAPQAPQGAQAPQQAPQGQQAAFQGAGAPLETSTLTAEEAALANTAFAALDANPGGVAPGSNGAASGPVRGADGRFVAPAPPQGDVIDV